MLCLLLELRCCFLCAFTIFPQTFNSHHSRMSSVACVTFTTYSSSNSHFLTVPVVHILRPPEVWGHSYTGGKMESVQGKHELLVDEQTTRCWDTLPCCYRFPPVISEAFTVRICHFLRPFAWGWYALVTFYLTPVSWLNVSDIWLTNSQLWSLI